MQRRCVAALVAAVVGACARGPGHPVDISSRPSATGALAGPVRWVHHGHHPTEVAAPAARLAEGGCIVVAPSGRWLVRPSEAARRQLSRRGDLRAADPTACVGVAELIPGPGRERTRRAVVDGEVVLALSPEGTLRRALSPRSPFEVVPTPTPLVDVGAGRGALFGVTVDGRVLIRMGDGWRELPAAPRDVVELGVLGVDVVALSLPERYTLLADRGAALVPMDVSPDARAAFERGLSVATCRDPAQAQPDLFEDVTWPTWCSDRRGPAEACTELARWGRRRAVLCGGESASTPRRLHLSLDGRSLRPGSVEWTKPARGGVDDARLDESRFVLTQPCDATVRSGCTGRELLVAHVGPGGFERAEVLPWPHEAALHLVWGEPRARRVLLVQHSVEGAWQLVVATWDGSRWTKDRHHRLPGSERPSVQVHRDPAGTIRVLVESPTRIASVEVSDWTYVALDDQGRLVARHDLPPAEAAAAFGPHVVLWPQRGTELVESRDGGATLFRIVAPQLAAIDPRERSSLACGPRGCTFGGQLTRLGWPALDGEHVAADRPWSIPAPDRGADDGLRSCASDPVVLRCVAAPMRGPAGSPGPSGSDDVLADTIGGRDALWRRVDRRRGHLELVDHDPGRPPRTVAMPACDADAMVFDGVEGVTCMHPSGRGARASWYAAATGATGTWSAPPTLQELGTQSHVWGALPSRDGLVVWRSDGTFLDVLAGPYGGATPPWQRVRGNAGMWTEDGLVTWTWRPFWQGRPSMFELRGHDATGSETWSLDTVARTASVPTSWYDVGVIPGADRWPSTRPRTPSARPGPGRRRGPQSRRCEAGR